MKTLNTYINEKLVLNKDTFRKAKYNYFPETRKELQDIINQILEEHKDDDVIDFNDIDISNINDISFLFYKRNDIHNIDVSKWDVSKVTNMNSIFAWCTNLDSVGDLSSWNVSKTKYMTGMFYNCKKLKSVGDLSKWNTKNIYNTDYIFYKCEKLKDIGDISDWNISKIKDMSNMFYGCENLKSVGDLSNWNINTYIVQIFSMFKNSGITDIPAWYNYNN